MKPLTFDEPRYADALDLREAAIRCMHDGTRMEELYDIDVRLRHMPADLAITEIKVLQTLLPRSEVFYLSTTIQRLLDTPARNFTGAWTFTKEQFPCPSGFVYIQNPPEIAGLTVPKEERVILTLAGFSWNLIEQGNRSAILFSLWSQSPGDYRRRTIRGLFPSNVRAVLDVPTGWEQYNMDRDLDGNEICWEDQSYNNYTVGLIVSFMAFTMQKIIEPEIFTPDRATRRRVQQRDPDAKPRVQVIRLRRKATQHQTLEEERHHVEWQCQWMVRGHWRTYSGKGGRKAQTIWISPYLKGDPEKPLREGGEKIFAVVR
jgi:hypothetical protein